MTYIRMYEAQLNSRMYEAQLNSRMYEAQLNYGNNRLEIVLYFFRS
jgi:hypothetical protein